MDRTSWTKEDTTIAWWAILLTILILPVLVVFYILSIPFGLEGQARRFFTLSGFGGR